MIHKLRQAFPLALLLTIAQIPRATYYYHAKRQAEPDKYGKVKDEITATIVTKLNTYIATYKANMLEQAAEFLKNDDYEGAISALKASLGTLNNDSEILATIQEYETYKPVDIATLHIIQGSDRLLPIGAITYDNYGNQYPVGYFIQSDSWDAKVTYLLNGGYTQVYGKIALRAEYKNSEYNDWIEFYDGDRLIGKTGTITAGSKPISFSFDISEVRELTVWFCSKNSWNQSHSNYDSAYLVTSGIFVKK